MLASLLLALICAWFMLRPHLAEISAGEEAVSSKLEQARDQKERLVRVLRDLELDFQTKKISAQEYEEMKASTSLELAEVLDTLDRKSHA